MVNRGGLTPSGLFMGLSSTIIYTSELILCSTICVLSATRHNIHMYPYFLFAAIHHLKSSPTFSVRPCSSVGRVTVDLIRRSWVRFPRRSKDFFFASCMSCGSLFPLSSAEVQAFVISIRCAKCTAGRKSNGSIRRRTSARCMSISRTSMDFSALAKFDSLKLTETHC